MSVERGRKRIFVERGLAILAGALLVGPVLAGDERKPPVIEDRILATVNNDPISRRTVIQRARLMNSYRQAEFNPQLEGAARARAQIEAKEMGELIEERLIIQEAARKDIKITKDDEEEIQAILERMAEPYGGIDGYKKTLEKIGSSFKVVEDKQRASLLIGKVYSTNVSAKIFIHPKDVREYYDQKKDEFMIEARTEVRRLRLTLDPEELTPPIKKWLVKQKRSWNADTCKILGAQLREDLSAGKASPSQLVKDFSMRFTDRDAAGLTIYTEDEDEDGYAEIKGIVGLAEICAELKEGETSQLREFRTTKGQLRGYQVVKLELRRKRAPIPFQRAQARITQIIRRKQFQVMANNWTRDLRARSDIRFFGR